MLQSVYVTQLQDFLKDPNDRFSSLVQKKRWINQARKDIAKDTQCIRARPRSSGTVLTGVVGAGGTGYTSATVEISAPDAQGVTTVQATATATVAAGAVTAITITNPGVGYMTAPTVTISGPGTGATATATISTFLATVVGQEEYTFAAASTVIQTPASNGYDKIIAVQGVDVSWGAWKPKMAFMDWSGFDAYYRAYNIASNNYPSVWSQYGRGAGGKVFLWPIPAVISPMEWDCYVTPIDLVDDTTADAVPEPWDTAVQFRAGWYAYNNAQRVDSARGADAQYRQFLLENGAGTTPARVPSYYAPS